MKESLYNITADMAAIEEALEESGGEITPELEEMWIETGESLRKKVDNYFALIDYLTDYAESAGQKAKRYQEKKKKAENALKRIKAHIMDVMTQFGISKLEGKDCKMSISSSTSTDVDEETVLKVYRARVPLLDLPAWISVDFKVNKTVLKDTFKDKDVTPAGVSFVKNTQLRIR